MNGNADAVPVATKKVAIKIANKAIELDSKDDVAWTNLGSAYYNNKQYSKSIHALNTALKLNPDSKFIKKILKLAREKDRVWKAFKLTGDESKCTTEIKGIMSRINELEKRRAELQCKIELTDNAEVDIEAIHEYCEKVRNNLGNLSFREKRKALEALKIRVISDKGQITINGTIPIVSGQCA